MWCSSYIWHCLIKLLYVRRPVNLTSNLSDIANHEDDDNDDQNDYLDLLGKGLNFEEDIEEKILK